MISLRRILKLKPELKPLQCIQNLMTNRRRDLLHLASIFQHVDKFELLKSINEANQYEILDRILMPFEHIDYNLQLKYKDLLISESLYEIAKTLEYDEKLSNTMRQHLDKLDYEKLFEVQDSIEPSKPNSKSRINLSIGRGINGEAKVVGKDPFSKKEKYRISQMREAYSQQVIPLTHSKAVSERFKSIAVHLQQLIRSTDETDWVGAQIRQTPNEQTMLTIQFNEKRSKKDRLDGIYELVREYFANGPGQECKLDSLYFEAINYAKKSTFVHLNGAKFLYYDNEAYYANTQFPPNFDSYQKAWKKIENLVETHFHDVDVVVSFNTNRTFTYSSMAKLGKTVTVMESSRIIMETVEESCKQKGITEKMRFHTSLQRIRMVLAYTIRELGDEIKIGFIYDDLTGEMKDYHKLAFKLALAEIRSFKQVKKIAYLGYNVVSTSFQNSIYNLFCGERRGDINIIGNPFLPQHLTTFDRTSTSLGFYATLYFQRE